MWNGRGDDLHQILFLCFLDVALPTIAFGSLAFSAVHELQGGAIKASPGQEQKGLWDAASWPCQQASGHQFQGHAAAGRLGSQTLLARHHSLGAPHPGYERNVLFQSLSNLPCPRSGMHILPFINSPICCRGLAIVESSHWRWEIVICTIFSANFRMKFQDECRLVSGLRIMRQPRDPQAYSLKPL